VPTEIGSGLDMGGVVFWGGLSAPCMNGCASACWVCMVKNHEGARSDSTASVLQIFLLWISEPHGVVAHGTSYSWPVSPWADI